MVREALWDDIPKLVDYISAFHKVSPYKHQTFSPGATRQILQNMINRPSACLFMHERGAIGGEVTQLKFGEAMVAQEVFWWAEKDGLALLKAFEDWAKRQNTDLICMASIVGSRLGRLYQRRGYQVREQFYVKEISWSL